MPRCGFENLMSELPVTFRSQMICRLLLVVLLILFSNGCVKGSGKLVENTKPLNKTNSLNLALWELAAGAELANDYEKAASYYDRLYERDPEDKKALLGYARNLRYLGLSKESIKAIQAVLNKFNNDSDLKIELAKSQLSASLINDAHVTLKEVAQIKPERWEVHSTLGIIHDRFENYHDAQKAYNRALELSPNNVDVKNNYALSLAQNGEIYKAIDILEDVIKRDSPSVQTRQNLAMLYGLSGQLKKARRIAQRDLPANLVEENIITFKELQASNVQDAEKSVLSKVQNRETIEIEQSIDRKIPSRGKAITSVRFFSKLGTGSVRKGPSRNHITVALLKKGDEVQLLGYSSDNQWSFIELIDGRRGYLESNLLRKTE